MLYVVIALVLLLCLIIEIAKNGEKRKAEALRQAEERARKEAEHKKQEDLCRQREAVQIRVQQEHQKKEEAIQRAIFAAPGSEKYRVEKMEEEATSQLLTITEFTPISKKRFVVVDTETTGLDHGDDAIIELAAVRVVDGVITDTYQQLIDPERPIPYEATNVNNITDDMVKGQPKIYEALPAFLTFVGDDVAVAHNAPFDARFIAQACMRNRFRAPARYFDTMEYARYWPTSPNKKLQTLIQVAGIETQSAHRALGDALATAQFVLVTNEKRKTKKNTQKE